MSKRVAALRMPLTDRADPVGPGCPEKVETHCSSEYFAVCERADWQDFDIIAIARGWHNAMWIFTLRWPPAQTDLF